LDHQQWLGDTLAKIAAEKAGIIKPGVPVVTATEASDALAVIEAVARQKTAPLTKVGPASRLSLFENEKLKTGATPVLPLPGEYQKTNAALALATVEVLQHQLPVSAGQIRTGLSTVSWPGRFQLIERGGQTFLLDGAHNQAGAEVLRAAWEETFPDTRPLLIFGALADKNWPEICQCLAPVASQIFTVPVASGRTADPTGLAKIFAAANPNAAVTPFDNLSAALKASKDRPFVMITGSLYLIGEALEQLGAFPAETNERGLNDWNAVPNRQ
jgi:dihydrofolate synthase/folylpolyglutamate synthase